MSPVNVVTSGFDLNLGFYEMFCFGLCFVLYFFKLLAGHGFQSFSPPVLAATSSKLILRHQMPGFHILARKSLFSIDFLCR